MQDLASFFLVRKDITFLNFGSFGACVKPVFERYQQYQLELEQESVQFITVNGPRYLLESRKALAAFINCDYDDLVYVVNPSYAVNLVAKSFNLQEGDEVLATDLEYGACDRTWEYYCKKKGAVYKRHPIRLPLQDKEDFITQFFKGVTTKTKLIFISHLTSTTALRFPVEEICKLAREKGICTFIDGAHAPGQLPVDLKNLDADFYTGACHKWMMTPKGSSFLYARKELQQTLDPLVVSWGYNALFPSDSQFIDYHQMQGTRDFSAFLTIPQAIQFMQEHEWPKVAEHYRKMTRDNAMPLCNLLQATPVAPINTDFTAQLYSAVIKTKEPEKLKNYLFNEHKIEIPVMRQDNTVYLRYSLNAFNSQEDVDKLFDAINTTKKRTTFIED
ncbi:MAG: aminotransferase class V-fold PLP-dependent enzyme [Sphingobacteriia bacterium]|nr:aminotransferase class V-fold PLP-dependent enzyme [Sphingobacteriia bacterium]